MLSPRGLKRLTISKPMSKAEKVALNARPLRTVLYLFLLLTTIWVLCNRGWEGLSLSTSGYQLSAIRLTGSDITASSRWVGGGSVAPPQPPPMTHKEDNSEKSLYELRLDTIKISFEEAVQDVELDGWEDDWFSSGTFDASKEAPLAEPKIDFVYNWVNGSQEEFKEIRHDFELRSPLSSNPEWLEQHAINRYRDWNELRYSLRSLDAYARPFINKIQILVNSVMTASGHDSNVKIMAPQRPTWLKEDLPTNNLIQVLPQESFFSDEVQHCLPTFNSLSIESQIHLTPSSTDRLVGLSDDMFLGRPAAPSDFFSPLFGTVIAFKNDQYNVKKPLSDVPSFGEKPFAHYTSYLLNRRFGERPRKVQAHFGHSISRSVMKEALASFPQPAAEGACQRFRGEAAYQIYPWYSHTHYLIERFREVLLWSFVMSRSDADGNGYLDWSERKIIIDALQPGWQELAAVDASKPAPRSQVRERMYYQLPKVLESAGLKPPQANADVLWTSLDGPETIRNIKCDNFVVSKCFPESFTSSASDASSANPDFSTSNVFSRLASEHPECGDCLIKFMLNSTPRGLEPLLPPKSSRQHERQVVIKALKKYSHVIVSSEANKFFMVTDAEQAEAELLDRTIEQNKSYAQWCLNDDVMTEDQEQVDKVQEIMKTVFETLWPKKARWER
ncbi:hypothetical protein BX600DRAFT_497336 [Xylariales sp. PMI_506]|nr:hypothetical protein BX600DRAFT_497336 [Xylariales sp. PMI_506]